MTSKFGYVTTACRLSEDIVPPDDPSSLDAVIKQRVVICGAVPPMVRSVRLYSVPSHLYVNIDRNGTVTARFSGQEAYLTISSQGIDLNLLIHSPKANRYLCFNKSWKLIGRNITRHEALSQPHCLFQESMMSGYNMYKSVANMSYFIGFNKAGRQVRKPIELVPWARYKCFYFLKQTKAFSITDHNNKLGGEQPNYELWRPPPPPIRKPNTKTIVKPEKHAPRQNALVYKGKGPRNRRHRKKKRLSPYNKKGYEDT